MRFISSGHLTRRMRERGIHPEQVQRTLEKGEVHVSSANSLCNRLTFEDGRTLKVWTVAGTREPRTIKSAAWEDEEY